MRGMTMHRPLIRGLEKEMVIHRKYSKEYGYTFFVLKNRNPQE
jgi:hypothetical protein